MVFATLQRTVVPNLPTSQRTTVKQCEINCNSNVNCTYMSVSYLLWNLGNYLSITALCLQICLPSIISNVTDHKNEIWKLLSLRRLTICILHHNPSSWIALIAKSNTPTSKLYMYKVLAHHEVFVSHFAQLCQKRVALRGKRSITGGRWVDKYT